jgi:hypothetical protein
MSEFGNTYFSYSFLCYVLNLLGISKWDELNPSFMNCDV